MNQRMLKKEPHLLNLCNNLDLLTLELRKEHNDNLFLSLIFPQFPIMNNSGKFKEISSTSFFSITPP